MFQLHNVTRKFGNELALNNVSLSINKGLNFILGSSGSGKTTLLKIISGMDKDFTGEAFYENMDIKTLTNSEKSYFYNNIFGFVWQDFNLMEELTVLENIMLPGFLKKSSSTKNAEKLLKDLKLWDIADKKVKYLSGGQKQRVAIIRELMKNPKVIIADEPTSALDEKTSKEVITLLRAIAKSRTVIIVTHDTSLVTDKDAVFELDKGELVLNTSRGANAKVIDVPTTSGHKLALNNAFSIAKTSIKRSSGKFIVSTISLMVAAVLLLTTFSGAIQNSSQSSFDELFKTYGDGLLDISVIDSFMSASGTGGKDKDEPNADVNQDISGLYEKYSTDDRVSLFGFMQAYNDISIDYDGKNYKVESSGNSPVVNKVLSGKMPSGSDYEVAVPESFIKELGITNEQAIGKEIDFSSRVYNWSTGEPVLKDVKIKATIVGVVDTTVVMVYEGNTTEYNIDDSFFFSKTALDDMSSQAEIDSSNLDFFIRANTPADMIAIKDELNEKGIVPLGRFELLEDMVRLNDQSTQQSGSASAIIGILSVIMVISIFLITSIMKRREYAIYKVSGFNNAHLHLLNLYDTIIQATTAALLMLVTSPLINFATKAFFGTNILNFKMLSTGVLLTFVVGLIAFTTSSFIYSKTDITLALKTGDR